MKTGPANDALQPPVGAGCEVDSPAACARHG